MACSCMNKIRQSNRDIQSDLARKAAMLDGEIYALYQKPDGTYGFDKISAEIKHPIVEYRHYL